MDKIKAEDATLSLIGAAALWSGWSTDLDLLTKPTVVLRPGAPWGGVAGPSPGSLNKGNSKRRPTGLLYIFG